MERLMQYVWQHRLWLPDDMHTVDGRRVTIIDPGMLNTDAGPDFFNAKITIDGQVWAGDIEIHVRASDWHRHNHTNDPAYNSVILHIVDRDDMPITRPDGRVIPQVEMTCSPEFHRVYADITGRSDIDLPCAHTIRELSPLYITDWVTGLAYERLLEKADRVTNLVQQLGGDWQSACYVTLARALGFGLNSEPFQRLALSTPLSVVAKHSDSLFTIEALLFGQSGLLNRPDAAASHYATRLAEEYRYMAHKFSLRSPGDLGWKMARMRPANFPHRRIAFLAAMLQGGFMLMGRLLKIQSVDDAKAIFSPTLSDHWTNHYTFGGESPQRVPSLSLSSVMSLTINVVAPVLMAYSRHINDPELSSTALALMQDIPAERNSLVEVFRLAGMKVPDAMTSQALIQARREYCQKHKCLYCRIGHRMLSIGAWRRR